MSKIKWLTIFVILMLVLAACSAATPEEAPVEEAEAPAAEAEAPAEEAEAPAEEEAEEALLKKLSRQRKR